MNSCFTVWSDVEYGGYLFELDPYFAEHTKIRFLGKMLLKATDQNRFLAYKEVRLGEVNASLSRSSCLPLFSFVCLHTLWPIPS